MEKKSFNPQLYDRVPTYNSSGNYRTVNREGKGNKHIYENSVYFAACIEYMADAVSSVQLIVEKRTKDNKWEIDTKHPLNILLESPNPHFSMSTIKNLLTKGLIINGNFLLGKEKKNGVTVSLWPIDVEKIYAERGTISLIKHYTYYGDNKTRKVINPNDILHFTRLGLNDFVWGQSEIKLGKRLFDFEQTSFNWNFNILKNQGLVPGIISVKDTLDKDQVEFIHQQMKDRKSGGPYAGEDLIIGADMDYTKLTLSNEDVAWIEGQNMTRDQIFMLMRVPLSLISPHLASGDIESQRMAFWQDRLNPILKSIEDVFNMQLLPEFADPQKYRVTFDKTKIRAYKDQIFQDTKALNALVKNGIKPRAAVAVLGFPIVQDDIIDGWWDASKYGEPVDPNDVVAQTVEVDNPMNSNRMGEEEGMRLPRPNEMLEEEQPQIEEGLMQDAKEYLNMQRQLLMKVDEELAPKAIEYLKAWGAIHYPKFYKKAGEFNIRMLDKLVKAEAPYKNVLPYFIDNLEKVILKEHLHD